MAQSDPERAAAEAVVAHHAQLAAELNNHVTPLRDAAAGQEPAWRVQQQALLRWLHTDLLPHAAAEEAVLYPAAADQTGGKLLVDGMLTEHEAITALVGELGGAATAVDAAAAGRALAALFEVHLAKENNLIVPLLLDTGHVSLAGLLHGMHDLLGADDAKEHV
jgi:iron-sulfur cluster repair protein YtfE (RIC family)